MHLDYPPEPRRRYTYNPPKETKITVEFGWLHMVLIAVALVCLMKGCQ